MSLLLAHHSHLIPKSNQFTIHSSNDLLTSSSALSPQPTTSSPSRFQITILDPIQSILYEPKVIILYSKCAPVILPYQQTPPT